MHAKALRRSQQQHNNNIITIQYYTRMALGNTGKCRYVNNSYTIESGRKLTTKLMKQSETVKFWLMPIYPKTIRFATHISIKRLLLRSFRIIINNTFSWSILTALQYTCVLSSSQCDNWRTGSVQHSRGRCNGIGWLSPCRVFDGIFRSNGYRRFTTAVGWCARLQ